jgi:predicted alpha/beta superfamily hydrolase
MTPSRRLRGLLTALVLTVAACDTAASAPAPAPAPAAAPAPAVQPVEPSDAITIGERFKLRSQVLGEERELLVYKPAIEPGAKYPVVYLLDGDRHFHHVSGLLEFLAGQGRMPPMILVGIANTDRGRDFSPTHQDRVANSGGADKFLDFIERELIPEVERRLPTAPYRILIGHSFGGLFAIHTLNTRSELFDGYISISPSTAWDGELPRRGTEALLRARPDIDKALYVSVGDEPGEQLDTNRAYAKALAAAAPKALRWRAEEMPNEDHGSLVHRSVYNGLELIFDLWRAPKDTATLAALEEHRAQVSARYRVPATIPEPTLNVFGYKLLGEGRTDEAIAAFRRNVELYPESANVHDSLGEALEKTGDRAGAATEYAAAVAAGERRGDQNVPLFRKNLERVRGPAPAK